MNPIIRIILSAVDNVSDVSKKSAKGLESFGESAKSVMKTVGAVFVTGAIAEFFKSTIDEAAEGRLGIERLGEAVQNAGGDFDTLGPALERTVAKVQAVSTATDDELRAALTNLITITGDVTSSQNALQLAADLAARKHISLEEASTLVGKAMQGNTKGLKDLGISTTDAATAIAQLQQKVGGFAQIEAESFTGGLKRAWNQLGEVKEAIGNVILSNGDLGASTSKVADLFGSLALFIERNEETFGLLVDVIGATAQQLGAAAGAIWDVVGPAVTWLAKVALGGLIAGLQTVAYGVRIGVDGWKLYAGTIAETLGEIVEKGGKILSAFGIHVGEETAASLKAWGQTMKDGAKRDASDATTQYLVAMDKFQQARQAKLRGVERDQQNHESTVTGIRVKANSDRAEEDEKAAAKVKAAHEKWDRESLKALENLGNALAKERERQGKDAGDAAELLAKELGVKLGEASAEAIGLTTAAMEGLLEKLRGKIPLDDWEALNEKLKTHKSRLEEMLPPADLLADAAKRAAAENKEIAEKQKEQREHLGKLTQQGATLARAFVDAASATGIIDEKMATVLNSAINLAAALPLAFAGDPASIAAAVTSLANIIVGIGSSETERRRQAAAAANTMALDRLTREVGNLNLRESGKTFTAVQDAVQASIEARDAARKSGKGPGEADQAAYAAFVASLKNAGIGLEEARGLFKELMGRDLAMANKGTFFQDILAFAEGLKKTEFGQYGQDVAGQLTAVADQIDLLGVTKDADKLGLYKKALGGKSTLVDQVLNASSPQDAIAKLKEIVLGLNSGAYVGKEALFGDFTGQQMVDVLKILKPLLEAMGASGAGMGAGTAALWSALPPAVATGLATLPDSIQASGPRPLVTDGALLPGMGNCSITIQDGAIPVTMEFPNATNAQEIIDLGVQELSLRLGRQLRLQLDSLGER